MKIKIAIATNINFYKHSLPIILDSLLKSGIERESIYVFNAGFNEKSDEIVDGIQYYYLNQNSYEYSPLIEIVERELESEYWFLIHDTCKVGERFKELLYNIPETKPEKLALKRKPAMSMGSYRYDYLLTIKDKLLSIKNVDFSKESLMKWKRWGVPNEDYILWMTSPEPMLYNDNNNWSVVKEENWYNTGTIRRTEYYESLDLYKNKSNWGQTGDNMIINI
jgi:hypothetical protein